MIRRIVVVCTGNICRSPMGEVVLRDRLEAAGLGVDVRSAGVSAEEAGNPIDARAASVLAEHGYAVPRHQARAVSRDDLSADLLLAMTDHHRRALLRQGADPARTRLWTEFVPDAGERDVADPWYGGRADFEETLDLIEAGAPAVVEAVRASAD
ncbi:low molecular weight phosphotyrosine protein phosphatase [Microbacterium betulae]|uniref:protein-tyrosine-phosphatase n=1 Tax=Microbacterium betulae TaxID=2981139 RepID=A0AA97FFI9_9MICO|nr:low molecular weight protein-tyrosine-phosphatase [Microbacterium sp. AB]WOF21454.1 low molecular weight phosphotyrosine protein phosphatase [Microbacterium sp. AB]